MVTKYQMSSDILIELSGYQLFGQESFIQDFVWLL